MSVEELVKRLRDGCNLQQRDGEIAADKLEELASENAQVRRERAEANNEWRKAYNELTVKAETALAEAKRENEALRGALEVLTANIVHAFPSIANLGPVKNAQQVLARNAGGNDAE